MIPIFPFLSRLAKPFRYQQMNVLRVGNFAINFVDLSLQKVSPEKQMKIRRGFFFFATICSYVFEIQNKGDRYAVLWSQTRSFSVFTLLKV